MARGAAVRGSVLGGWTRVRIGLAERRGRVGAWCVCSAASERASERERERAGLLSFVSPRLFPLPSAGRLLGVCSVGAVTSAGVQVGSGGAVYLVCAQALFVVCAARVHCGRARLEGARRIADAGRLVGAGALRRGWLAARHWEGPEGREESSEPRNNETSKKPRPGVGSKDILLSITDCGLVDRALA